MLLVRTIRCMDGDVGTFACSACDYARRKIAGSLSELCAGHKPALRILRRTDPEASDEKLLRILGALPTTRIPLGWWWELLPGVTDSPPSWYWATPVGPDLSDRLVDACFVVSETGQLYEFSGNPLIHPPQAIAQAMSERYGTSTQPPDRSVKVMQRVMALMSVH